MPGIVVVGGQWGDEGNGRVVDLVARKAHVVARYSGGSNAGHTVVNQLGEFRLHLVPAGIFYSDKVCVIGNGVVIDPAVLLEEIQTWRNAASASRSPHQRPQPHCHALSPHHRPPG
jgi:adenylosuccinate synthase